MALTAYQKKLLENKNTVNPTTPPIGATTTPPPTAGETRTPPLPNAGATTGATTPPTTGANPAATGNAYQKYQEMEARKERDRIITSGDTRAINQYLQQENMNRTANRLADSGNTQAAEQMRRSMEAQARASAFLNGNQQQNKTYSPQQTPYKAAIAAAQPVTMNDYTWWDWMGDNKLTNMSEGDKTKWDRAVAGWKTGDYSAFNDDFETVGNWSSYVDDNGNVNGMLRYVGDGVGGYIPVSNGVLLQNEGFSNDPNTYAFYGPNGEVYTADANGRLTRTGNWTREVRERRVPDGGLHGTFKSSNGQTYDYDTAPEDVLARYGFVRGSDGKVKIMDDNDALLYAVKSGQATPYQAAIVNSALINGGSLPSAPNPAPTNYAAEYTSRTPSTNPAPSTRPSTNPAPAQNVQPVQNTQNSQPVQAAPPISNAPAQLGQNAYQRYLDQWDYPDAPEWNGTDYERQRDELLANAMNPYEGSPYDQQRDDALAQYGEKWQGSEYQPKRDEALRRAEEMQWNYDPNTDPVWQALQKQYRREGDRATQEAMAQAAMRTGGLANSYAVTAASQAGDYYAAQLSDRLPQLYQDAYQRYLQEFQRQMGISDQYQGFDDREYSRWMDQQGKNLDLADRYNQYGQQDYNRYMDRVSQQLQGADRYNQYGGTEYQRYLDQLGQYNTDRNFSYGRYRDAVGDYRYDDETQYNRAWNEEARDYNRAYQAQRDAILDNRADREWAQELRAYADAQGWKQAEWEQYLREYGDQLSDKQRQWAYQMQRDAISDERWERQYADQRSDTMYNRALQEDQTAYQRALYDQEYADQRGDTAWEQGYKQTAYNDEMERTALNYLNTNGIVTGRYAEILGVPDGTTYEQYYSRYLGGGSTSPFDETEIPSGTTPKYTPPPMSPPPGDIPPAEPPVTVTLPELKSRYGNDTAMEVWSYAGRPWYAELHELAQTNMAAALDRIYDLTRQGEVSKDENAQKALMEMLGITEAALDYEAPKYGGSTGLYATYNAKGGSYKDKNFVNIPG